MNRLKARSMDRKLDQQIKSQINGLKARSKDWLLDQHIEGQINSSAKDIANKNDSNKADVENAVAYVLAKKCMPVQRGSIKSIQRDSIKPAQVGSTRTASSGSSKPAGNGK